VKLLVIQAVKANLTTSDCQFVELLLYSFPVAFSIIFKASVLDISLVGLKLVFFEIIQALSNASMYGQAQSLGLVFETSLNLFSQVDFGVNHAILTATFAISCLKTFLSRL